MKRTRCLTWGEERNAGTVRINGAIAHFAEVITICRRPTQEGDPRILWELPDSPYRRPSRVCRACFAGYRAAATLPPNHDDGEKP